MAKETFSSSGIKDKLVLCRILILTFCGYLMAGCSSAPVEKESPSHPSAVSSQGNLRGTSAENREYLELEALYSKNATDEALARIPTFQRRFPRSKLQGTVENLYGLLLLRDKKAPQAIVHFRRAANLSRESQITLQYILYNLATAEFDANRIDDAQQTLSEIRLESLDKGNRLKAYYLKAGIYEKKSLPLESTRQLLTAGRLFSELNSRENRKIFNKLLDQSLQEMSDVTLLEKLYHEFEDSLAVDSVLFRLGTQEVALGNTGNGEVYLKTLMEKYPQSLYYSQASAFLSKSRSQETVDTTSVGVLLPIKGKFAKYGMKSLQGIQLAFGIFNSAEVDSKLNLVVEDSGEEPEQAIKAVNRLVFKHHVVAIIGPMVTKGVDQISQRAQELGVPLISLARRASSQSDYVFQGGLTQQIQAYEIARYAYQRLGARRFAMIFPNEKLGTEIGQAFWDAVESFGGKMVGVESYSPGETDFRHAVDKLSGLYYTEARQRELNLLAQEREANQIKRKTRKTEQFYALRPIVDYDVVFVPDEPKVAGQILPTFAYRDIERVRFLGTSSWNSPDFLNRAQSYAEHSTFVDAFFAESQSPRSRKFYDKYKATFSQEPTTLEALAYDAGQILFRILSSSGEGISRADLRNELRAVHDFPGVTGKITFRDGQFYRDLRVITVKNGHFTEVP